MLLDGKVAPSIKVKDGSIVEENHRYIAGMLYGRIPEILAPSKALKYDLFDWGNR